MIHHTIRCVHSVNQCQNRMFIELIFQLERHSSPLTSKSPEIVRRTTTQQCRCHPVFKFAQSVMDELSSEQQKKFTIDVTKLLLKYQENNLG